MKRHPLADGDSEVLRLLQEASAEADSQVPLRCGM